MNLNELSTNQVYLLLTEVKIFLNHPNLNIPKIGHYRHESVVIDRLNTISYKLHIYRGKLINKYSLHLRFTSTNTHLVRLCINGPIHHNDDGSRIGRNHIHIYTYHDGYIENYAHSLDNFPFKETTNLEEAIEAFMRYIHLHCA